MKPPRPGTVQNKTEFFLNASTLFAKGAQNSSRSWAGEESFWLNTDLTHIFTALPLPHNTLEYSSVRFTLLSVLRNVIPLLSTFFLSQTSWEITKQSVKSSLLPVLFPLEALKAGATSAARHQMALLRWGCNMATNTASTLPPGFKLILAAASGGDRPN